MVSFQCNACSDVVKKPKLEQHYASCHAGFDCIDCSTTFHTPAEFKGHTSCITEAEKYQKGLYKGKRKGDGKGQKEIPGATAQDVQNEKSGVESHVEVNDDNCEATSSPKPTKPADATSSLEKPKKERHRHKKSRLEDPTKKEKLGDDTTVNPASESLPSSLEKPSKKELKHKEKGQKAEAKHKQKEQTRTESGDEEKTKKMESKGNDKTRKKKESKGATIESTGLEAHLEKPKERKVAKKAKESAQNEAGMAIDAATLEEQPNTTKPVKSVDKKERKKKGKKNTGGGDVESKPLEQKKSNSKQDTKDKKTKKKGAKDDLAAAVSCEDKSINKENGCSETVTPITEEVIPARQSILSEPLANPQLKKRKKNIKDGAVDEHRSEPPEHLQKKDKKRKRVEAPTDLDPVPVKDKKKRKKDKGTVNA